MPKRDQVFVSYSHKDKASLQRLRVHLKPFEREESIKVWSDQNIRASQKWKDEIKKALQQTAVAILLVSADFLASDFIANEELPHLLTAAEGEGVLILPCILTACAFSNSKLSHFQTVNDPAKPLRELANPKREKLWADLAVTTKAALEKFEAQQKGDNEARRAVASTRGKIKWNKVATLFWLGNDLMWIQDMVYREAPFQRVLQGVDNAIVYANDLGFSEKSYLIERLTFLKENIQGSIALPLTHEDYEEQIQTSYAVIGQITESMKWFINSLAIEKQPDFEKKRALLIRRSPGP
jgi:hypothetical protein